MVPLHTTVLSAAQKGSKSVHRAPLSNMNNHTTNIIYIEINISKFPHLFFFSFPHRSYLQACESCGIHTIGRGFRLHSGATMEGQSVVDLSK